jgi:uncharacterized protein YqgC (DUF456 family)
MIVELTLAMNPVWHYMVQSPLAAALGWRIAAIIVLIAAVLSGLFLAALGGPGTWIVAISTALFMWWDETPRFWEILIAMCSLAALAEVMEFALSARLVRSQGGGKQAAWAALGGGLAGGLLLTGLVPIPVLGTIIGAAVGCFLGALAAELGVTGEFRKSLAVGLAAAIGRTLGTTWKLLTTLIMAALSLSAIVLSALE